MKIRKQIQRSGKDSAMIRVTKKELELYGWEIGDVVDISDIAIVKRNLEE